jgi:succinate-semialdehyde dehydrogenase/glutarate-semialdehyde dehydrogenase
MKSILTTLASKPIILPSRISRATPLRFLSTSLPRSQHQVPPLQDKSLFKEQSYVNGKWVGAASGDTFEVTDPATGKVIGTMPEMDGSDTNAAIKAASDALVSFRRTTARERANILRKWYDLMMANSEDLARLITWENGKPYNDSKGEVTYAASFYNWFSEEAPRLYGDTIPATVAGNRVFTIREPVGVCGLITVRRHHPLYRTFLTPF